MNACTMRSKVDRHFAGTISPLAERAMREHLPTCTACRALYRHHLILARLDPQALSSEERIARGLGLRRPSRAGTVISIGAATAAAAAVALFVGSGSGMDGFSARGKGVSPERPLSRVFVYDVRPGAAPELAGDAVRIGDELAFSYQNGASKRRLMIFGVDEHSHVYWFHPSWTNEVDDPVAIPIEADDKRHELPEAIRHRFDGAHLEIRSVFVDDPMTVRQVEALLQRKPNGALPIPGAVEHSISLAVAP
jgi:hypothetical protein